MTEPTSQQIDDFITRWQASGAAERANFPAFTYELCDLIGVPRPEPTQALEAENSYVFEKAVPLPHGTVGRIDLYKRGCFILEAKQGSDQKEATTTTFSASALHQQRRKRGTAVRGTAGWDTAMEKAKQQAQSYARHLPLNEIENGRPPLLITVDIGHTIALYSEFSRTGGHYMPFPDPHTYRLAMSDLHDPNVRQLLRQVWADPMSLDPSRRSARVTRQIAAQLGQLAKSLEEAGHDPQTVAQFLMRCLFTMFAEDVGLLPERSFAQLLHDFRRDVASFQPMLEHLWHTMNSGGFSVILRTPIPQFNGGLFAQPTALPLTAAQLHLLAEAAGADWRDVEPAIFGTLLERALDTHERHKLGAHYTPRAYVERLVEPTVIAPLRAEWEAVQTAVALQADSGQTSQAIADIQTFHRRLTSLRILDPACGSGNFLYVTLEHLKRLEGEVLNTLRDLGEGQMLLEMESVTVSPQQFLGIEVNPRAAAIAELVLWIGYIQWHIRTTGDVPHAEPIIKDYHNIECRDAVLAWDSIEPLLDEQGQPVTRWDGRSTKKHPITGQDIPDETARVPAYQYLNPRPADWPTADFIVGNPPFIANRNLRADLGEGYVDALNVSFQGIREAVDFVMYFWYMASEKVINKQARRSGLITTNSIRMIQNQGVVQRALDSGGRLLFAIPDHPWPGDGYDARVRISMTVLGHADSEQNPAKLVIAPGHDEVATSRRDELPYDEFKVMIVQNIPPDLSPHIDISGMSELLAWKGLCHAGMKPYAKDLIISQADAENFFPDGDNRKKYAPLYRNGSDVARNPRGVHVLDFYEVEIDEIQRKYPKVYQHLLLKVKPQRETVRNPKLQQFWWQFEANRPELRDGLSNLDRYIVTVENSPLRYFVFLDKEVMPDQKLRVIASNDAYILGVLSSLIHSVFAFRAGGRQGVANTPVYNTRCCTHFPFPDASDEQKATIRHLAEQLDAHRQRQLAQHPQLTMTDMYNVLEKLRAASQPPGGSSPQATPSANPPGGLSPKERQIHEWGLVSILQQVHEELDTAVAAAYGWPANLPDEEILQRLVDLNAQRAAEEANGHIRWLRPDYQAPETAVQATQLDLTDLEDLSGLDAPTLPSTQAWPATITEQVQAIRAALTALAAPVTASEIAALYGRRTEKRIQQINDLLDTLTTLGHAQKVGGKYSSL